MRVLWRHLYIVISEVIGDIWSFVSFKLFLLGLSVFWLADDDSFASTIIQLSNEYRVNHFNYI